VAAAPCIVRPSARTAPLVTCHNRGGQVQLRTFTRCDRPVSNHSTTSPRWSSGSGRCGAPRRRPARPTCGPRGESCRCPHKIGIAPDRSCGAWPDPARHAYAARVLLLPAPTIGRGRSGSCQPLTPRLRVPPDRRRAVGRGAAAPSVWRRCVRKCMEDNQCFDF
jgi:hypothetical protein